MVPALPPFSLRAIPSTSLTIVRGGHFGLAGHHFIGWLPIPTAESFIQSGAGDHSIDPPNHFAYADADDTPEDLHATVEGIAEVKLSGPLAAPGRVHGKRLIHPHYEDCTRGGVNDIRRAIWDAATDLRHAYVGVKYIEGHHTDEWAVMYERWFGTYSKVGRDTVKKIIDYMWGKIRFASSTFVCRTGEDAGIPAKLCNYTLQPWGCCSVTDTSLDQSPKNESRSTEGSRTARTLPGQTHFSAWPAIEVATSKTSQLV